MTISVSVAGEADAESVSALAARTFPLACPPGTAADAIASFIETVLSPARFRDYVADPERTVLLAYDGPTLSGYALLIRTTPSDPDVLASLTTTPSVEVSKLYVDPDHHGSAVAAALMTAAVENAETHAIPALWLGVNNENARAQKFYAKSGFSIVGKKTFTLGTEVHHDYVMERLTPTRSETTPASAT